MFKRYRDLFARQLAIELNCEPGDFFRADDLLTEAAANEGRRVYISKKPFLQMTTFGGNIVITADPVLHGYLRGFMGGETHGHWLFSVPNFVKLNAELNKYGYELTQTHHMLLPYRDVQPRGDLKVKWFFDDEILPFYGDKRFGNALCPEPTAERPDRIAVCAYDGDTIMGMAGCSEDASHLLQIGIDVSPEYRSRGIGTALVTMLKNKIIERGELPFYGSAMGNYHSQAIAVNSGFKPAWIDIEAVKIKSE